MSNFFYNEISEKDKYINVLRHINRIATNKYLEKHPTNGLAKNNLYEYYKKMQEFLKPINLAINIISHCPSSLLEKMPEDVLNSGNINFNNLKTLVSKIYQLPSNNKQIIIADYDTKIAFSALYFAASLAIFASTIIYSYASNLAMDPTATSSILIPIIITISTIAIAASLLIGMGYVESKEKWEKICETKPREFANLENNIQEIKKLFEDTETLEHTNKL